MSSLITAPIDGTIACLFDDLAEPAVIVTRSPDVVAAVVGAASDVETPPLRLLAPRAALRDATADFLVASRAADLVRDDRLAIRSVTAVPESQLVVTETAVTAIVTVDETMAALSAEENEFVAAASDHYADEWEGAAEFTLRTPALSRVRETLRETFGPEFEADFTTMIESHGSITGDDGPDIVELCLLLAAKHGELLYELGRWSEDVGVASKASVSRKKTGLEERGLIDTEKVPIDIGRPRLRLELADDRLRSASIVELAAVAETVIRESG